MFSFDHRLGTKNMDISYKCIIRSQDEKLRFHVPFNFYDQSEHSGFVYKMDQYGFKLQ